MTLSELFHDAVDEIEPTDRLAEIRARTTPAPAPAARPWWYAAGGVVLATAAAVTAFAVLDVEGGGSGRTVPGQHDHATPPPVQLVAAYFVGDTARGTRLFREFDETVGGDPLQAALDRIEQPAADPDYRTAWTPSSFGEVQVVDGVIEVEVEAAGDRELEDDLAVQQVVYTLQGALQERLPVRIGETTYDARPEAEVLSPVSISDPAEGSEYDGLFIARGRANVLEGTVVWEVQEPSGRTVLEGVATALGTGLDTGQRLYPWEARVDVSGLPAGTYTFLAAGTDPSGGAELARLDHDTRTIVVR